MADDKELEYYSTRFYGLLKALKQWPLLPEPRTLKQLGSAGKWPEDWERGKAMQRELKLDAIPPVTECELGAGFWDRITEGAWREALTTPKETSNV